MGNKVTAFLENCNCYAVENGNDIAIVDPGQTDEVLLKYINEHKEKVRYVLLTHCHFDHIMGAEKVLNLTGAKLVIHKLDEIGLSNPEYSLCDMFGFKQPIISADIPVDDNSLLPFGDDKIRVVHTPGHTRGSVVYFIGKDAFCGDTVFLNSVGRTDFCGGSVKDMQNSIKKLSGIEGNYTLYPGHGEKTELNYEREHNPYF